MSETVDTAIYPHACVCCIYGAVASISEGDLFAQSVLKQLKENSDMLKGLLVQTQAQQEEIAGIKENVLKVQSASKGVKNTRTVPICVSVCTIHNYTMYYYVPCREKFGEYIKYCLKMMILMGG